MSDVANKNGMIARRATQVVVILRDQGAQHRERPFLLQPFRALFLQVVCGGRLLANRRLRHVTGVSSRLRELPAAAIPALKAHAHRVIAATIHFVTFLAFYPAKPDARPCGT
jgi:hypothetical protein